MYLSIKQQILNMFYFYIYIYFQLDKQHALTVYFKTGISIWKALLNVEEEEEEEGYKNNNSAI